MACILAAGLAGSASAQVIGRAFEFSGRAGYMFFDDRSRFDNAPLLEGSLSWRYTPGITLEASGLITKTEFHPTGDEAWFSGYGLDVRWNLREPSGRVVPYLLTGLHAIKSRLPAGVYPGALGKKVDDDERGTPSAGLGVLFAVADNDRVYVRCQVRDTWFTDRGQENLSNDLSPTLGVTYVWGGKPRDSDNDGVRDWLDKCPGTPLGAKVDAHGCPTDADGDGVFDGLDQCAGTPKGCMVDAKGCPLDADGDGVCDGLDKCADTPKGATVDANGCPTDSDGDGVLDGLDQCADTPKGCVVDANGCPLDADGDGVCDGLDQCPNTPADAKVDPNGCPIVISEREVQLLDTGLIRMQDINFDTGKASIKAGSDSLVREVGQILVQYPMLKIEIGGHTDNRGSKKLNEALSHARADSVLARIRAYFPAIADTQFTTAGYGFDQPVASNATEIGRAKNRRVEFKVLNTDALRIEREKRRYLKKDE
jgi:outer membrane protein OmpA-like peptidoglycan-associated protein